MNFWQFSRHFYLYIENFNIFNDVFDKIHDFLTISIPFRMIYMSIFANIMTFLILIAFSMVFTKIFPIFKTFQQFLQHFLKHVGCIFFSVVSYEPKIEWILTKNKLQKKKDPSKSYTQIHTSIVTHHAVTRLHHVDWSRMSTDVYLRARYSIFTYNTCTCTWTSYTISIHILFIWNNELIIVL